MRCPKCGAELGDALLPARCPQCGQLLARRAPKHDQTRPEGAPALAATLRKTVEGLSGRARERHAQEGSSKHSGRIVVGIALVLGFCAIVLLVAYQTELVGGRSVPDVVGWRQDRAVAELEADGFVTSLVDGDADQGEARMVIATSPAAGVRAAPGSTVSLEVAAAPAGTSN